jgi:hypothetical protein
MIGLKAGKAHALIIGPLPLPPRMEGPTLTFVIMVSGVGVDIAS